MKKGDKLEESNIVGGEEESLRLEKFQIGRKKFA